MAEIKQFLKNYLNIKTQHGTVGIMKTIVSWDVDGASEADLLTMDQDLTKLCKAAASQAEVARKEREEAVAINKVYAQKLAALDILQKRKAATTDAAIISEIDAVLQEEITALQAMRPEIEREMREADEAEEYQKELEDMAAAANTQLLSLRKRLESAKKNVERDKLSVEREKATLRQKQEMAGISSKINNLSTALGVMEKQSEEARQEAAALKMKSNLLGAGDKKNSLMEEAMAEAAGTTPVSSLSIEEQIAALKI